MLINNPSCISQSKVFLSKCQKLGEDGYMLQYPSFSSSTNQEMVFFKDTEGFYMYKHKASIPNILIIFKILKCL